jgi:hypothetical protein
MNGSPLSGLGESGGLLIMSLRRLNRDAAMKQVQRMENNRKAKGKDGRETQEELEKSEF